MNKDQSAAEEAGFEASDEQTAYFLGIGARPMRAPVMVEGAAAKTNRYACETKMAIHRCGCVIGMLQEHEYPQAQAFPRAHRPFDRSIQPNIGHSESDQVAVWRKDLGKAQESANVLEG